MRKNPSSLELKVGDCIKVIEHYDIPNRPNRTSEGVITKVFTERINGVNYIGYQAKYNEPPGKSPVVLLSNRCVWYYTLIKMEHTQK